MSSRLWVLWMYDCDLVHFENFEFTLCVSLLSFLNPLHIAAVLCLLQHWRLRQSHSYNSCLLLLSLFICQKGLHPNEWLSSDRRLLKHAWVMVNQITNCRSRPNVQGARSCVDQFGVWYFARFSSEVFAEDKILPHLRARWPRLCFSNWTRCIHIWSRKTCLMFGIYHMIALLARHTVKWADILIQPFRDYCFHLSLFFKPYSTRLGSISRFIYFLTYQRKSWKDATTS